MPAGTSATGKKASPSGTSDIAVRYARHKHRRYSTFGLHKAMFNNYAQ